MTYLCFLRSNDPVLMHSGRLGPQGTSPPSLQRSSKGSYWPLALSICFQMTLLWQLEIEVLS